MGSCERGPYRNGESNSPFRQTVFDFDTDGKVFFSPQEVLLKAPSKGYLIASASKIEASLGNEEPEECLDKTALLEKAVRIHFGITSHAFYTLSAAATLVAGHNPNPRWKESCLTRLLQTWKPAEVSKATQILQEQDRFVNQYDYQNLWRILEQRMFAQPPFSANMPLSWTYPSSGDRLPSPQEIGEEWQKQGLSEYGSRFATACLKLERETAGSEFSPWNLRANYFELSAILMIKTIDPPIKLIVPVRLDQLYYQPQNNAFEPVVYDLKTRLPLDYQSHPIKRPSLAVFLYRLAAERMNRSDWPSAESPIIYLDDNDFSLAVNNERKNCFPEENRPPRVFFRTFTGQTTEIVTREVDPDEDWREKLLPLLYQAQEKLKQKV